MNKFSFDEHVEILKRILEVDPLIKKGEEAQEYIDKYGGSKITNGGYIYKDNLNTIAMRDSNRIGTLAHEMRHAWQFKNKNDEGFQFVIFEKKDICYYIRYYAGKNELDANKFAFRYCRLMGLNKQSREYLVTITATWLLRLSVPISILLAMALNQIIK